MGYQPNGCEPDPLYLQEPVVPEATSQTAETNEALISSTASNATYKDYEETGPRDGMLQHLDSMAASLASPGFEAGSPGSTPRSSVKYADESGITLLDTRSSAEVSC